MKLDLNYVLIAMVILTVSMAYWGYKTGLIKSIIRLFDWLAVGMGFILVEMLLRFHKADNTTDAFITFLLLVILLLGWRVLRTIFGAAKLLSKIPVIHGLDKLLGILFGIAEACILFWLLSMVLQNYSLGRIGDYLRSQIVTNTYLDFLYENNYLIVLEQYLENKLIELF